MENLLFSASAKSHKHMVNPKFQNSFLGPDYVRPQENGHRTYNRWISLTDGRNKGLLIIADETVGFNALRNAVEDFDSEETKNTSYQFNNFSLEDRMANSEEKAKNIRPRQTHINDIIPRNFIEVCIPSDKNYSWGFTLMPVEDEKDLSDKVNLKY